jgi:TATA-box binding protein (TBP) (component of TFIID and TFIIIB)
MNNETDIFYKLKKKIEYDLKPEETQISTMTICLNMNNNCKFHCFNIGKYLKIDNNFIDDIIFSDENNEIKYRNLNKKKKKKKKEKKVSTKSRKDSFYNQVTIIVKISPEKNINVKLFKNGSIQMTGCDSIANAKKSIERIFELLNTTRHLLDFPNKKIKEIKFIKTKNNMKLVLNHIISGKVVLINCNFNIRFKINRDNLYEIITNNKNDSVLEIKKQESNHNMHNDYPQKYIDCTFDPIRHACVNIKLNHPTKIITIFVFESGSIIILGTTCRQIRDAYNFINVFLMTNYFNVSCLT